MSWNTLANQTWKILMLKKPVIIENSEGLSYLSFTKNSLKGEKISLVGDSKIFSSEGELSRIFILFFLL